MKNNRIASFNSLLLILIFLLFSMSTMDSHLDEKLRRRIEEQGVEIYRRR